MVLTLQLALNPELNRILPATMFLQMTAWSPSPAESANGENPAYKMKYRVTYVTMPDDILINHEIFHVHSYIFSEVHFCDCKSFNMNMRVCYIVGL